MRETTFRSCKNAAPGPCDREDPTARARNCCPDYPSLSCIQDFLHSPYSQFIMIVPPEVVKRFPRSRPPPAGQNPMRLHVLTGNADLCPGWHNERCIAGVDRRIWRTGVTPESRRDQAGIWRRSVDSPSVPVRRQNYPFYQRCGTLLRLDDWASGLVP